MRLSVKCIACGALHNNKKYCTRECMLSSPEWIESLRVPKGKTSLNSRLESHLLDLLALIDGKRTYQDLMRKLNLEVCAHNYTRLSKLFRVLKERGLVCSSRKGRNIIYKVIE